MQRLPLPSGTSCLLVSTTRAVDAEASVGFDVECFDFFKVFFGDRIPFFASLIVRFGRVPLLNVSSSSSESVETFELA